MGIIKVEKNVGGIPDLCIVNPKIFEDKRGCFMETYNTRDYLNAGINIKFVQFNQSRSKRGVLRGLHFQKVNPQSKLVYVNHGKVYDVVVDLRKDSPTYGKHFGTYLSGMNKKQLFIPRGFAHGYIVLSNMAEFCYFCDDFYDPNDEGGIAWNDPTLAIKWPMVSGEFKGDASSEWYSFNGHNLIISEKDQKWPFLF